MSTSLPPLPSLPLLSIPNIPLSFTLPPSTSAIPNTSGTHPSTLRVHSSTTRTNRHNPATRSARSRRGTPSAPGVTRSAENVNVPVRGSSVGAGTRAWAEANARGGLERALNGRLPFGMDLVLEERDLSEEEDEWEDRNQTICEFGRTFLVPFGFRKTQEEIDAVQSRSPSPSPPSNAEDLGSGHEPIAGRAGPGAREESDDGEDPDEQPDLDADLEGSSEAESGDGDEESMQDSMVQG